MTFIRKERGRVGWDYRNRVFSKSKSKSNMAG